VLISADRVDNVDTRRINCQACITPQIQLQQRLLLPRGAELSEVLLHWLKEL